MIGLALLYFIWKYYSELATEHGKHKWGFALLGIATYYAGTVVGGILLVVFGILINSNFVEDTGDAVLGLMAFPFGLLSVWGLYKILQKKWSNAAVTLDSESLDGDLLKEKNKN
ncbi:MAG: hypothetical protein JNL60_10680 [Bacteroidia bacterium]|nr:hypothetical protein [Bacteroidia bacterium]